MNMADPLNVLLLEDRELDAQLLLRTLRSAGFAPNWKRVETEAAFVRALDPALDMILADYQLPQFDALHALKLHRAGGLDVPFIVVSGTIGEEAAAAMIKEGATDYLLKDRLARLGSAVRSSIDGRHASRRRRETEAQLRETQERFRTVVELCPDVIAIHSEGKIEYVNPAASRVLGIRSGDLVGRRVLDLVHPDSRSALARSEPGSIVEAQLVRADGNRVDVEVTTTPIVHNGRIGTLAILRDVTQKLRAEVRYRELFERVPVGLYSTAADGSVLAANGALAEILGYSTSAAMIGVKAGEVFYANPEERAEWTRRVLAEGVVTAHPMRFRRLDGTEVWVENNVRTVTEVESGLVHFDGAIKDISARVRAQAALEERIELAQFAADVAQALTEIQSLPDMLRHCAEIMVERLGAAFARFWTLDADQEVLELRASAGLYTHVDGPHRRVPVGRFKIGLIASERRPHLTNSVIGDPRVSDQEWAKREGMVAFAGHPLLVEDRLVGVMAMFSRTPLSPTVLDALASVGQGIGLAIENRLATVALNAALAKAKAADKLKSDFLANMSHEIRTPLNVILGYNSLIADELEDRRTAALDAALDAISRASHRLIATVHGILDLSRLEAGDFKISAEDLDIASIVEDCAEQFRESAARKGLALSIAMAEATPRVRMDDYCLRRALERLLDNAVKFTEVGEIAVRVYSDDSGVLCLSIRDTGIGIDGRFLPKLFTPFFQEDSGVTRRFEGPGIGLALVKRYLELNRVDVDLQSDKGAGTTVTLRFTGERRRDR